MIAQQVSSIEVNVHDVITKRKMMEPHGNEAFGASVACVLAMFFQQNNLCVGGAATEELTTAPLNTASEEPMQPSAPSPSSSSGTPPQRKRGRVQRANATTDEDRIQKRRKHRDMMVLFRLKKKQQFEAMKAQEQRLQDELHAALQVYHTRRQARSGSNTPPSRHQQLMDQFAHALSTKESLLHGNRVLEQHVSEQIKFQRLVAFELERAAAISHHATMLEDPGVQTGASRDAIPRSIRLEIENHQIFLPTAR